MSEAMDATTGEMFAVKQVMAPELRPRAVEILQRYSPRQQALQPLQKSANGSLT